MKPLEKNIDTLALRCTRAIMDCMNDKNLDSNQEENSDYYYLNVKPFAFARVTDLLFEDYPGIECCSDACVKIKHNSVDLTVSRLYIKISRELTYNSVLGFLQSKIIVLKRGWKRFNPFIEEKEPRTMGVSSIIWFTRLESFESEDIAIRCMFKDFCLSSDFYQCWSGPDKTIRLLIHEDHIQNFIEIFHFELDSSN